MKKAYTLLLLAGAVGLSAAAENKFDALGSMVMNTYKHFQLNPSADRSLCDMLPVSADVLQGRSAERVSVMVKVAPGASASDLEVRGVEVISKVGRIFVVSGTLDDINALNDCDFVEAMSFGELRKPLLDLARKHTGMDSIHQGIGLPQAYNGTGVVTGIMDTGVDANHANFYNLDTDETRVGAIWNFTSSDGRSREYVGDDIYRFETDDKTESHGTHTLGCMAGSYNREGGKVATMSREVVRPRAVTVNATTPNPYYGMAPGSTIAIGCGPLYDRNTTTAASKVLEYAQQNDMPAVLNLSIGSNIGAHDGSSLTCQTLNELGKDMIICIAAGNEGADNMSIDKTFGPDETEFITFFTCDDATFSGYIDFWSDSSTPFEIHPLVFDAVENEILDELEWKGGQNGETVNLSTQKGTSYSNLDAFTRYFSSSSVLMQSSTNTGTNNRYNVLMQARLTWHRTANRSKEYVLGFRVIGKPGQRITATTNGVGSSGAAAGFSNMEWDEYVNGSPDFSISSMASFDNCIVVGAWNTAIWWPALSGSYYGYADDDLLRSEVANYSSYGIDDRGIALPDVCAPGTAIISSISTYYYNYMSSYYGTQYTNTVSASQSYDGRNNYWESMQGTSMACPVVAGAIATWLQAKPDLTVAEAKRIIKATATRDRNVTSFEPAIKWGAGKFNAYAGLKEVLKGSGVDDVLVDNKNPMLVTPAGPSAWDITVPGATSVKADLYNLQGVKVASAAADSHNVLLQADGLAKGVYVVNVNGKESQRVLVK